MSEVIWKKFHNVEVSNTGLIKTPRFKDGYSGSDNGRGYKLITVTINNKQKVFQVHRLICHLFLGLDIADTKIQVNHINCIRDDNRVENLELVTSKENNQKRKSHLAGRLIFTTKKNGHNSKPWCSYININGKSKNLGYYKTEQEAHIIAIESYNKEHGSYPHCGCEHCINRTFI